MTNKSRNNAKGNGRSFEIGKLIFEMKYFFSYNKQIYFVALKWLLLDSFVHNYDWSKLEAL